MDTYKMDIDKIRALSFSKGMSLSKLCESAGMSRNRATEWKHRGVNPRTVYRIAQVLDVDPEELILNAAAVEHKLSLMNKGNGGK